MYIKLTIMKCLIFVCFLFLSVTGFSQIEVPGKLNTDSMLVVVHKDPRIDLLVKKQIQINEETTREARKVAKGFRLLVINTNKREDAIAAKTKLYSYFPELKTYLVYQSPYFKLKAGNFKTREEAEEYRKKVSTFFPNGVFVMNDIIEVKLDKFPAEEDENIQ